MNFSFNVHLTQQDYLEFNKIVMFETQSGKKILKSGRILFAVFFAIAAFFVMIYYKFSPASFIGVFILLVLYGLSFFIEKPFMNLSIKATVKALTDSNTKKAPYSEDSVMEFYDDFFTDTSADGKHEVNYSSVEDVCINEKFIILFVNKTLAYPIPASAFESLEQRVQFVNFIKTKCRNIIF